MSRKSPYKPQKRLKSQHFSLLFILFFISWDLPATLVIPINRLVKQESCTLQTDIFSQRFHLTKENHRYVFIPEEHYYFHNGKFIPTTTATLIIGGELHLPQEIIRTMNLTSALLGTETKDTGTRTSGQPIHRPNRCQRKIIIDPGHGGKDTGAIGKDGETTEKSIVLQFSKRLREQILQQTGCPVFISRNDDLYLPLSSRTKLANQLNAELFISVHANASSNSDAEGFEIYVASSENEDYTEHALAKEENFPEKMPEAERKKLQTLLYILNDLKNNHLRQKSIQLADQIHQEMIKTGKIHGKKHIRNGPFFVLLDADMPAILLEIGFVSHAEELKKIADPVIQATYAYRVAKGITNYLNLHPNKETP